MRKSHPGLLLNKKSLGRFKVPIVIILLSCVFFACKIHYVSYYDSLTYKNLTDLKGEMGVAFETFSVEGASGADDLAVLEDFKVKIAMALEYESGKKLNDDTIDQFMALDGFIREVIVRFKENDNQLSAGYCKGKWRNLEEAFDIAIATEKGKIENMQ